MCLVSFIMNKKRLPNFWHLFFEIYFICLLTRYYTTVRIFVESKKGIKKWLNILSVNWQKMPELM